jgi:hypothetical protein
MKKWNHPGTFMSPEMTFTLQQACSEPLRKSALDKLIKDTPLTHIASPLAIVDIDWGGKGNGHKECTKDGEIAVSAALIYWCTADIRYATLACDILRGWATVNKVWKGNNGLLEASWSICSMARAAELLKYAKNKEVIDVLKPVLSSFISWLDTVIMPVLKSEHIWYWDVVGNWHFSQICARMQIAILREDAKEWDWCVKKYRIAVAATFGGNPKCVGANSETCRDITHSQMQLGGIAQAAEMALHQGVDLYDNRLISAYELQARIMMREIPDGLSAADIKTPYGYWQEPVWHIVHTHFVGRKKLTMPKTSQYIEKIGIDRVTFHWGPNYLTHFKRKMI